MPQMVSLFRWDRHIYPSLKIEDSELSPHIDRHLVLKKGAKGFEMFSGNEEATGKENVDPNSLVSNRVLL